jgi:hypothetical protein
MRSLAIQLSFLPYRYFSGLFRNLDVPFSLILSTFLRLKKPLQLGKSIFPLNYQVILELLNYSLYQKELQRSPAGPMFFFYQWQLISFATQQERKLLQESISLGVPHEVCQITLTTSSGEQKRSAIFHGGLFSVATEKLFWTKIAELLGDHKRDDVKRIEIIHTHPSIDFILETNQDESFIYLNGLSQQDLQLAQNISKKYSGILKIKAVTHSELSYSAAFVNGQAIRY